jgi:uncharacterized protein (UPF0332 family)
MTGDDFLSLARRLLVTHQADAAAMRTVASRAYYAVFHSAKMLLDEIGFPVPKTENAHLFIQVRLIHANQADASEAGALLGALHESRKRADYDLSIARYETLDFAGGSCAGKAEKLSTRARY